VVADQQFFLVLLWILELKWRDLVGFTGSPGTHLNLQKLIHEFVDQAGLAV
jgi:hypothetical protein